MVNVFNRALSVSKTFGEIEVGQYFRLDVGNGKGSYFLKTGATGALWIWTSPGTEEHTGGPVKAGSCAHFSSAARVTPASFSPADGD